MSLVIPTLTLPTFHDVENTDQWLERMHTLHCYTTMAYGAANLQLLRLLGPVPLELSLDPEWMELGLELGLLTMFCDAARQRHSAFLSRLREKLAQDDKPECCFPAHSDETAYHHERLLRQIVGQVERSLDATEQLLAGIPNLESARINRQQSDEFLELLPALEQLLKNLMAARKKDLADAAPDGLG